MIFFHLHKWSEWDAHYMNKRVSVHDKTLYRFCRTCGDTEYKIIELDCTKHRRTGKWCGMCALTIERNKDIAFFNSLRYYESMKGITGRKPNYEMIEKVKALREQGMSYREIHKKLNRRLQSVYIWANYDVEARKEKEKLDKSVT